MRWRKILPANLTGWAARALWGLRGGPHRAGGAVRPGRSSLHGGQLAALYGGAVHSEDLSWLSREVDPVRTGKMELAGKEYQAACFGRQAITWNGGLCEPGILAPGKRIRRF